MSDITPLHGEALAKALESQKPEKAVSPTGEPYLPPRWVGPLMALHAALTGLAGYLVLFEADPLAKKVGIGVGLVLAVLGPLLGQASPGWRRRAGKVLVAMLAVGLSTGCVNFRPPPPSRVASLAPEAAPFEFQPPPECKTYDRDRKVWGALGRSAALGSGAAGLTSLVTDNDSGGLRRGFGLASLALGIFAAGASWYADQQAADFVSRCTQQ